MNMRTCYLIAAVITCAVILLACGKSKAGNGSTGPAETSSTRATKSVTQQDGFQPVVCSDTTGTVNAALHARVTLHGGAFFNGGWGHGRSVDPDTIVDGVFLPRSNQWDQGPVWWDSRDNIDRYITLDVGGIFRIESVVVQADDNDAYILYFRDPATGNWQVAWNVPNYDVYPDASSWGMQTRPDPFNNETKYVLPQPIVTDALMFRGDMDSGDRLFSVSEIQAFGTPVNSCVVSPGIDIKPGGFPNSISAGSEGKIPVAILSTETFSAPANVAVSTLTFGRTGDEASLAFCNEGGEDVNGDGMADLVCHFFTPLTGFQEGDIEGVLKGRTLEGVFFTAKDSVRIVGK